ncbi:hypothetical protein HGRIS_006070 [Hohenbuehelia grisea]|uniref:RNA helicase n=1 Tax=Hohenbuehelia grisea TaxID=104357 RepID=A0ABR3JZL9_9AGAR
MGPAPRERFNARARQSSAGGSHKKRSKRRVDSGVDDPSESGGPNAPIVILKTKEERELDRKERLKQELIAANANSKWTSKKKQRLDKYIDKKLRKDERKVLFEKLSQSQAELPSTLGLQSTSTLGTGKASTHQERLDRLEDKAVRRALDGQLGKRKRAVDRYDVVDESDGSESDEARAGTLNERSQDEEDDQIAHMPSTSTPSEVGSALHRNPDGSVVQARVRPKKSGPKSVFQSWKNSKARREHQDSDSSFDSSDSAYDSSEDEGSMGSQGEDESDNASGVEEEGDSEAGDSSEAGREATAEEAEPPPKKRKLGFKEWATKQLNAAKGYDKKPSSPPAPSNATDLPPTQPKPKRTDDGLPLPMHGPLGEILRLPSTSFAERLDSSKSANVKVVNVTRPADVEEARVFLPIVAEEQPIMEAILLNPVIIICGETGSGKTTQVPQFLYEAGFGTPGSDNPGMIGVTQPRRVAAMSMASRVAHELSLTPSKVSYQIRYDATVSPSTSIKFMTDGVLLRELATDFLLKKYSVIIIDEAHERSMNTDILIGVLSRVLKLREQMWKEGKDDIKPLRLIIMSATLRVSDFAENKSLFPTPPPVINVAARQHPVTIHFSRRTTSDYIAEAIKKTSKIHARLPPGGILIFLTGQNEITGVCRQLEAKFGKKALADRKKRRVDKTFGAEVAAAIFETKHAGARQGDVEAEEVELGIDNELAFDVDEGVDQDDVMDSDEDEALNQELGIDAEESDTPMHVVPLYSLLPSEKQMLVFKPPPEGSRLVVVSTNVAETSLTIPGIRYVVDCGRAKERRYDAKSGVQSFQVGWVSKASASQRAGRAGRTGPGHCYRLYSSALFEHYFDAFSQPEILRMPIEGVVLQMTSMHIDVVTNFPFPTPPDRVMLRKAEVLLTHLGALLSASSSSGSSLVNDALSSKTGGHITELGKSMALFPLSPRFSRMLVSGQQKGCLPYVIAAVSALSVGDPFLHEEGLTADKQDEEDEMNDEGDLAAINAKEAQRARRKAFFQSQQTHASLGNSTSDVFKVLSVVGAYEYSGGGLKFCADHFVRPKAMEEIHKLRAQISNIVDANFPGIDAGFSPKLPPPSNLQIKVLRQLLAAAFIDHVAVRKDCVERTTSRGTQFATARGIPYRALGVEEDVFIHPSSVLANNAPPEYVVFNEIVQTSKAWMKGVTVVNAAWLSSLGKSQCSFSKPVKDINGVLMTTPYFGPDRWELPPIKHKAECS